MSVDSSDIWVPIDFQNGSFYRALPGRPVAFPPFAQTSCGNDLPPDWDIPLLTPKAGVAPGMGPVLLQGCKGWLQANALLLPFRLHQSLMRVVWTRSALISCSLVFVVVVVNYHPLIAILGNAQARLGTSGPGLSILLRSLTLKPSSVLTPLPAYRTTRHPQLHRPTEAALEQRTTSTEAPRPLTSYYSRTGSSSSPSRSPRLSPCMVLGFKFGG